MKRFCTIWLLCTLAAAATARGAEDPWVKARGLLLGGKYSEAAELYAPAAAKDPAAALGLARCLESQGKPFEAVQTLTALAKGHAGVQAELARLAFERGDYTEAKTRTEEAIRLDEHRLPALWIRAELDRVVGRLQDAELGYRRLITFYNAHQDEIDRAESLHWVGLAAARYARWNRLDGQFSFLVNDLYPDALKLDAAYWPARYEAGMLFLEKYNRAEASRELKAALKLNPNAAEVHVALAHLAVARRDMEKAEESILKALEINPSLLSAWLGKADLAWANFEVREALQVLEEKALPLNPVSEATLARMAACYALLDGSPRSGRPPRSDRPTRFSRLVDQVAQQNPRAGDFFHTLGVQMQARNKQSEAKRFFLTAIEKMPQKVGPRSHLGLLHMRAGREDDARKLLKEAFDVDPFNVRVHNMLSVLEVLDTMETLETEHLILRYDAKQDKLLARYAAKHLERVYPELCRQFNYRPPGKPLVEIFNQSRGASGQQWFSTRLIGLPYLGAVAASTGPLVAMASPNDPQKSRRFNWARVLGHELVHVISLQQTHFNIPHWYTEGLAVYLEGQSREPLWNELLLERVPGGHLFNLRTLNFGFSRPNSSRDWQMAYCQAELYVEYMLSRWGTGQQRKLLTAYAEGLATADAIPQVFGISQEEFEKGYVAYLQELIGGMTSLEWPSEASFAELLEAHRDAPKDAGAAAELAYAHLERSADKEALELAEGVLKNHPKHQLATYVLARLRMKDKKNREAVELLEGCLDDKSPQPNVLKLLAGLKLKAQQYDEAIRLYSLGERLDSVHLEWTQSLARAYLAAENQPKLTEVLTRLARADSDDLTARKKLAEMTLKQRDYAAAADWANQALAIDVTDGDVHRVLAEARVGLGNYVEAIEEFDVAIELAPEEPHRRFALADACVQANQTAKARQVLQALLKLVPDYPGAALLLESLEETEPP